MGVVSTGLAKVKCYMLATADKCCHIQHRYRVYECVSGYIYLTFWCAAYADVIRTSTVTALAIYTATTDTVSIEQAVVFMCAHFVKCVHA